MFADVWMSERSQDLDLGNVDDLKEAPWPEQTSPQSGYFRSALSQAIKTKGELKGFARKIRIYTREARDPLRQADASPSFLKPLHLSRARATAGSL